MERDPDPTLGLHRWPVYFREPLAPFTALTSGRKQLLRFMLDGERSGADWGNQYFTVGKHRFSAKKKKTNKQKNPTQKT